MRFGFLQQSCFISVMVPYWESLPHFFQRLAEHPQLVVCDEVPWSILFTHSWSQRMNQNNMWSPDFSSSDTCRHSVKTYYVSHITYITQLSTAIGLSCTSHGPVYTHFPWLLKTGQVGSCGQTVNRELAAQQKALLPHWTPIPLLTAV